MPLEAALVAWFARIYVPKVIRGSGGICDLDKNKFVLSNFYISLRFYSSITRSKKVKGSPGFSEMFPGLFVSASTERALELYLLFYSFIVT
jgi:hypothetical protein